MTLFGLCGGLASRTPTRTVVVGLVAALTVAAAAAAARVSTAQRPTAKPDVESGKRIYREGILPSGEPVRAVLQGDVAVEGKQFSCAACHRRSGLGSSEGSVLVPPLTEASLYREKDWRRADLFRKLYQEVQTKPFVARVHDPRPRPAYTDETLAVALREGRDPSGRAFGPLMPRYLLSDEDAGHVAAYLKSLSHAPAPGVSESTIHFATVVTEGADAGKRKAMLDVMGAYFRWKNADTRGQLQRPGHSPWHADDFYNAYREWELHVWELKGAPETWPAQLQSFYRERPVFALVGGVGAGTWQPVHDFCERAEVPCLFPNTDLPAVSADGAYAIYFSKGLTVEAEALAQHLRDAFASDGAARVVQVYREGEESGAVPARALRRALHAHGFTRLSDRVIPGGRRPTSAFLKSLLEDEKPSALVLWLGGADFDALRLSEEVGGAPPQVYLSHSLLADAPPTLAESLRGKVRLTYPFALPLHEPPQARRVRAWLRSRGVEKGHERIQFKTHFALSVVDHSLAALVENFSRDYFVELVEQETESTPNPGIFPQMSLGPGQRFASKGSYIVRPSATAAGGVEAVSEWIRP